MRFNFKKWRVWIFIQHVKHRSANNRFVFVVGKRKIISGVIFDVESESGIKISLSRQDFCTEHKNFFCFFFHISSFSTTLSLKNELLNSHQRFFSQRYGHIKFWHLSEQPYEHSHWLFGAYHSAFDNLSWKYVFAGFDVLWIRIYSHKTDISISKMADRNLRN